VGLMAGSARLDITPTAPTRMAGYAGRKELHDGVLDPISLRALYLRGSSGDVLLVTADILWFHADGITRMSEMMAAQMGLQPERILFCGTHSHAAPDVRTDARGETVNWEWLAHLEAKAVAAAALAKLRLQPVALKGARGSSAIGINRRELLPDGRVILGKNPEGPIDREIVAVSVQAEDGQVVAQIGNFACHGVVLGNRNLKISGDWCGVAASSIEEDLNGGAFMFVNGGSGNINSLHHPHVEYEPVLELANQFVSDCGEMNRSLASLTEDDEVGGLEETLHLPRKHKDVEDGMGRTRPITIKGLRIGPLRLAGFPGEVFSETTIAVKEGSPHDWTMVASYTAGGHGGYVPVKEAYDTGGYEVSASPFSEDAEAVLRKGFLHLLSRL
jgi:neutral ceramidase